MNSRQRILIGSGLVLLAFAVALMVYSSVTWPKGKGRHLAEVLPRELPGRVAQDIPLGATEALTAVTVEALGYDDMVYRGFDHPSLGELSLYVAYWNPGKRDVASNATHTPDNCWPASGWECVEKKDDYEVKAGNTTPLLPAKWRKFKTPSGVVRYVVYWHLVDGALFNPDLERPLSVNPVSFLLKGGRLSDYSKWAREQYFIRVVSAQPFEALQAGEDFRVVTDAIGRLGLAKSVGTGAKIVSH